MKKRKWVVMAVLCMLMTTVFTTTALATESGNVAGAIESTWKAVAGQIKTVVNNVVFPVIDTILAILFFVKVHPPSPCNVTLAAPPGSL